jgi:hypothetical protein
MRLSRTLGVRDLLLRGLATMPQVRDTSAAADELEERLADEDCALFVHGRGFLIAENNRSAFVGACVVIHFYTEQLGELPPLLEECLQFARAGGMERFQGIDINFLTPRAYRRLLGSLPSELRMLGMTYEVRV